MDPRAPFLRLLAYLWASPTTLLGLLIAGISLVTRGRAARSEGTIEVHGGLAKLLLDRCIPIAGGAAALTLGHVVLGRSAASLDRHRRHERVHVRQCERWGPLFLPAYLAASLWAWSRGRDPYRDNLFEREAFGAEGR